MRVSHRSLSLSLAVGASVLALGAATVAQSSQQVGAKKVSNWGYQAEGPDPELPPLKPGEKFDARDFSGVWEADHTSTRGFRTMTEEEMRQAFGDADPFFG